LAEPPLAAVSPEHGGLIQFGSLILRRQGSVPLRQQRLVEAWAELHQGELLADWDLLQQGKSPAPIAPLQ